MSFDQPIKEALKDALYQAISNLRQSGDETLLRFVEIASSNEKDSKQLLAAMYHAEKSDKKRDLMMPISMLLVYPEQLSMDDVKAMIDFAKARKKLNKWSLKYMDESSIPSLFFINGEALDQDAIRFLFYRVRRSKNDLDAEARLFLSQIDKSTSVAFAQFCLDVFIQAGSKSNQKYLLNLAAFLGDDSIREALKKMFRQFVNGRRTKMGQHILIAIAQNKDVAALRFIEWVSRRYRQKESLANMTHALLSLAANEQGVTKEELLDSLLPDFGFDDLYKTIEIKGKEYRVFIGNDFKLQYLSEENDISNSLPRGASLELKSSVKAIQKEIREVNRAQKDRLEQYMILERKWSYAAWQSYLTNPLMFVYVSTLVWGVYDAKDQLVSLFFVDEDASILDIHEDEISLSAEMRIGLVHPIQMPLALREQWAALFYERNLEQPFDQLHRRIYQVEKREVRFLEIDRYHKRQAAIGSRAVQGYFEKRGWRKNVGDAGCFDLYREFAQHDMKAELDVYGLCLGWFSEEVTFYKIKFRRLSTNKKIRLELINYPKLVFSEVIADMEGMSYKKEEKKKLWN